MIVKALCNVIVCGKLSFVIVMAIHNVVIVCGETESSDCYGYT